MHALHPLTCGQRWVHHVALHAPSLARPVQRIYRLSPDTDPDALQAALRHVVRGAQALRLRLVRTPAGWRQRFPDWMPDVEGLAVRGGTPAHQAAYGLRALARHAAQPLDLTRQPPLAAHLVRTDGELLLALTVDHLAADDTGFDLLEDRLARAYAAEAEGRAPPPEAGDRFCDYVAREAACAPREAAALGYWKGELVGAPLEPGDPHDDAVRWVPGASTQARVDGAGGLAAACRAAGCSPFVALLAAQALLLAQVSGGWDRVFNVPVSNRVSAGERAMPAHVSMLLHPRLRLDPRATTRALLRTVRDGVLRGMAHRHYDYPALSDAVAEDARARGGRAQWMAGCSYVAEDSAGRPAACLLERLDGGASSGVHVPRGSFALQCRHRPDALHLDVLWDLAAWPVSPADLSYNLRRYLHALTGPDGPLPPLRSPG